MLPASNARITSVLFTHFINKSGIT